MLAAASGQWVQPWPAALALVFACDIVDTRDGGFVVHALLSHQRLAVTNITAAGAYQRT
ncbi:MAG: hypothetical protein RJA10_25 [Pseudomonadota bacterium]